MTTLPERLKELASRMNQDGDKYDAFTLLAEAVQALQAQEVVKETTINHARDPHCCGCYVIRWNDGAPVAECNECRATVALLDGLASPAQADGFVLVPRELVERIVRDSMPATITGHTCFVPRYQLDELRSLLTAAPSAPRAGDTAQDSGQGERLN